MTWLVLLFLAYALLTNTKDTPQIGNTVLPEPEVIANAAKLNLSDFKNKVLPQNRTAFSVKDVVAGKGSPAVCGQDVKIAYDAFMEESNLIESVGREKPLSFRVGAGKAMLALEHGVVGMQPNGTRSISAGPDLAYSSKDHAHEGVPDDAAIRFEVELLSVSPTLPDLNSTLFRIADTTLGSGKVILCGQPAKAHVTVWNAAGKKTFSTKDKGKPVEFTPGKSEVFLGLEQGIIGMQVGGKRMLVVPPSFQKTLHSNAPNEPIPLPQTQIAIVDIEALQ